jgi:quercetin dioxygenase-like cupin family protein
MRRACAAAAVLLAAGLVMAQDAAAPGPVVRPESAQRFAASGSLPPGAEYHLIREVPGSKGVQALVRVPNGYFIPAHSHSAAETLLVLRGKLRLDFGASASALKAGEYALIPAGTAFSLKSEGWGGAEFLIVFDGPYDAKPAELPKKPAP